MSSRNSAAKWTNLANTFVNGWGPGLGATLATDRERDVAAYERQRAALPKKPPGQRPRETTEPDQTDVARSAVQSS
jgi:hypothetical protein